MSRSSMKSISAGLIGAVTLAVLSEGIAGSAAGWGLGQGNEQVLAGSWTINQDLSDELRPQLGGRDGMAVGAAQAASATPVGDRGAASAVAGVMADEVVSAVGAADSADSVATRGRWPGCGRTCRRRW
ncbi:MAG: hypothetical protein OXG72_12825, partial [Acidobacteria bacterium]|nr:hypothetical protein [Acidobacteriota bacterium]